MTFSGRLVSVTSIALQPIRERSRQVGRGSGTVRPFPFPPQLAVSGMANGGRSACHGAASTMLIRLLFTL